MQSDPSEDAVHQTDGRFRRRNEAADLRHERDDGHLADVSGLTRHIGAGQHHYPRAVVREVHIVGHVGADVQDPFHHRVAAVGDPDSVALVESRPDVAVLHRGVGQPGEDVQPGDGRGDPADGAGGLGQLSADSVINGPFGFLQSVFGVQHQRLVFFQLRDDVPFGVGQGLAADVVLGDLIDVGLGDLDVIAKDLVVPDFQALDLGAFPFSLLQSSDELTCVGRGTFQLVHLRREAGPDDVPVTDSPRRVRRDGLFDQRAHIWQRRKLVLEPSEFWPVGQLSQAGYGGQTVLEGDQLPGSNCAGHDASDDTL